jgi:hypothetical protein
VALGAAVSTRGLVGAFTFIIQLATLAVLIPHAFSSMGLVVSDLR